MLAAYLMLTRERILGFFRSLVRPSGARRLRRAARAHGPRASRASCAGSSSSAASTACSAPIGFAIVGLKYWPVMALVAAVFSLIPIFGSIASAVPAVALGAHAGPRHGDLRPRLDRRHPPARGERAQPEDHGRRREDSPGARHLLAARGGALLPRRRARSWRCRPCRSRRACSCTSAPRRTTRTRSWPRGVGRRVRPGVGEGEPPWMSVAQGHGEGGQGHGEGRRGHGEGRRGLVRPMGARPTSTRAWRPSPRPGDLRRGPVPSWTSARPTRTTARRPSPCPRRPSSDACPRWIERPSDLAGEFVDIAPAGTL